MAAVDAPSWPPPPAPFDGFDLAAEADARSFFAQPEPLKWTAGDAKTLRIGPPQTGHVDGPCTWTPCMTSTS